MRVAYVLVLVAACSGSPSDQAPIVGEYHSDFLGVTLTFPAGWRATPLDKARQSSPKMRMLSSRFMHFDGTVLPDAVIDVDIQEHATTDAPTAAEQFDRAEGAFSEALANQPGGQRVGACDYVPATAIIRCIAHSGAPLARTIIEYNWYIDGRRINLGVLSANPDQEIVRSEGDAIARSVH